MKKFSLAILSLTLLFAMSCNNGEDVKKDNNEGVKTDAVIEAVVFNTVDDMIADAKTKIEEISAEKFKAMMDAEEAFLLIDIRTENEFSKGSIKNAVNIPRGLLEFKIKKAVFWEDALIYMPKNDELIILTCKSGKRAVLGTLTLKSMGYTNVKYLNAGFSTFKTAYPDAVEIPEGVEEAEEEEGGC